MYYVSYGSNMNVEQMAYRCPNTKIYGNGKVKGWKLVFNYHADIIETGKESDSVPVVVWELDNKNDEKRLDRYEGYPTYYVKRIIPVVMDNGKKIRAMVYVMNDFHKGIYPPTQLYFDGILEGYHTNGIDTKPLFDALKFSLNEDNFTEHNQYNPIA